MKEDIFLSLCANTFSHTINPNPSFPLFHSSQSPPLPSSSFLLRFISSLQKRRPLKTTANRTKQDTMRKGKSPHTEAGQGNPIGRKGSQEQAEKSDIILTSTATSLQKCQNKPNQTKQANKQKPS